MTPSPARRFPWIVLAYLGPLALVPLLATYLAGGRRVRRAAADAAGLDAESRSEIAWHAWQGCLLAVMEVVVIGGLTAFAGYTVLSNIGVGFAVAIVAWLLWFTVLSVHLAAIVAGLTDRRLALPVVGLLASRLAGTR